MPITGGIAPVRISGALAAGGNVFTAVISPDSSRVAFAADKLTAGVVLLHSVPIAGGTIVTDSGGMVAGGNVNVNDSSFTPDSVRLVFIADKQTFGVRELYTVPAASGLAPTKLSGTMVAGGGVSQMRLTPDGSRVVLFGDKESDETFELFVTGISLAMDIDGNGIVDALTDGLLLIRWQFGLRGAALIAGAVAADATRTSVAQIEGYLTRLDVQPGNN